MFPPAARRRAAPPPHPAAAAALALACLLAPSVSHSQTVPTTAMVPGAAGLAAASSELRDLVARYSTDRAALLRRWDVDYSPARRERMRAFYEEWQVRAGEIDPGPLSVEGAIDHVLLQNELRYRLKRLDREADDFGEMASLLPFATTISSLEESRRAGEPVDPARAAQLLDELSDQIEDRTEALEGELSSEAGPAPITAFRAARTTDELAESLDDWFEFHAGYDPLFTWWVAQPYARASGQLEEYRDFLRERLVGLAPAGDADEESRDEDPIIGDPIGAEALAVDIEHELLAYDARELIEIAEREYAWCVQQLKIAAAELGYGDDWHAALEHVKALHLDPGEQPALVRELAFEAVTFIEDRDLVTVPPLANEIWRMEMLSPESQKTAPFFLGGEVVQVAFPTDGMSQEEKQMSLRSNNVHFSRAVVHHELIPGHHLQGFMTARYNTHRRAFSTPFWGEGWALYWEMLLWDLGFPRTPEDRIGMLFWRTHRAARIIFSLKFHLGEMTAEQAVDFLVDGVGHERSAATAEVRRSFNGDYPPLYQAAYMIGGLQLLALHEELVDSGQMSNREFHDAILQGGSMPIEMHRARLTGRTPGWVFTPEWEFAAE